MDIMYLSKTSQKKNIPIEKVPNFELIKIPINERLVDLNYACWKPQQPRLAIELTNKAN